MADNVAITAGSGTTIATDDVSGVHYQKVKVYAGTDGTEAAFTRAEDAAHTDGDHGILALGVREYAGAGTDGDYSAIAVAATGEARVMAHRDLKRIAVDSGGLTTITTSYTAGDQVGNQFTLANAARVSGGTGTIVGVTLTDANDIIGAYDVVITRASVTLAADNAAYSISDADAKNVVGVIQLSGAWDLTNNRIAQAFNIAIPYDCSGGTSLYAGLITRYGHGVFAAVTDLQLVVWVERN